MYYFDGNVYSIFLITQIYFFFVINNIMFTIKCVIKIAPA